MIDFKGWWNSLSQPVRGAFLLGVLMCWVPALLVLILYGMRWIYEQFIWGSWPWTIGALMTIGMSALTVLYTLVMVGGVVKFLWDDIIRRKR